MGPPAGVIGIGWVMHDSILLVREYPAEDTKAEALSQLDQLGGPVARALSVLSSLGIRTAIGAAVGDDVSGAICKKALDERGVGSQALEVVAAGVTRKAQVWVSAQTGSRTIAYCRSSLPNLEAPASLVAATDEAEILHLDGREMTAAMPVAAKMCKMRKTVVVDAGGWKPNLEPLLKFATILIVPLRSLRAKTLGNAATEAMRLCERYELRAVVVTDGSRGAWAVEAATIQHVPAPVVQAVDTHGAGDAFAGGFIYGLLTGRSLLESVRFGSGVAALGCGRFGDFFPSADAVAELLEVRGES